MPIEFKNDDDDDDLVKVKISLFLSPFLPFTHILLIIIIITIRFDKKDKYIEYEWRFMMM